MQSLLTLLQTPGVDHVRRRTALIIFCGLLALILYSSWWFQEGRIWSPWLFMTFVLALLYSIVQIIGSWVLYLAAHYADRRRL